MVPPAQAVPAPSGSAGFDPATVVALHRSVGNAQVQRMLQRQTSGRARSGAVAGPEAAKHAADALNDVKGKLSLKELSFEGLAAFIATVTGLESATGTASASLDVEFGATVGTGIANAADISVYLPITLSGAFSVGDDRRFRVDGSIGFGVQVEAKIKRLFKVHAGGALSIGLSGAYQDHYHFAARVFEAIAKLIRKLKSVIAKVLRSRDKEVDPKLAAEVQKLGPPPKGWEQLAQIPMEFWQLKKTAAVTAGFDFAETAGIESGLSYESSTSHKKDDEGNEIIKKGSTKTLSVEVYCNWGGAVDVKIGLTVTRIEGDANPDNDGDYMAVRLQPGKGIPITPEFVERLAERIPTSLENFSKASFESAMDQNIKDAAGSSYGEMFDDPAAATEQTGGIDFAFIRDMAGKGETDENKPRFLAFKPGDWSLMYARIFKGKSIGFEGEAAAPVVPGVNVGTKAGFGFNRESGMVEILGAKSLAYFRSFYNGLLNRGDRGLAQWQSWKKQNELYLHRFMEAVGTPGTPAYAEAAELHAEIESAALDLPGVGTMNKIATPGFAALKKKASAFQPGCAEWFKPENVKKADQQKRRATYMRQGYDLLDELFDAYLEVYRQKVLLEDKKAWHHKGNLVAGVNLLGSWAQVDIARIDAIKGDEDDSWLTNLRIAAEYGYKARLSINGRRPIMAFEFQGDSDGDVAGIREDFRKKVKAKFKHLEDFPLDLAMLDKDTHDHYKKLKTHMATPEGVNRKVRSEAQARRDAAWNSSLDGHLDKVFDVILDAPVKSRPPAKAKK